MHQDVSRPERETYDGPRIVPPVTPLSSTEERSGADLTRGDRELETRNGLADRADRATGRTVRIESATVLNALDRAIAVVDPEWRVVMVNGAWERVLGESARDCVKRDLFHCFPLLAGAPAVDLLRATHADGATRQFEVVRERADRMERFGVRVASSPEGFLLLEVATPSEIRVDGRDPVLALQDEENASLRELARQMAAVADSRELLRVLCTMAAAQCGGSGAAVVKTGAEHGEVVAATGALHGALAQRFTLEGSVTREVIESRGTVLVDSFGASSRPLARMVPELAVGPLVAAPLVAHDVQLGVLAVAREEHAVMFAPREVQRLRVIADHAALAMWKAELLDRSEAADLAKGRFLATISHELRTPLTALTGYEELLADEVLGPLTTSQADVVERMRSVTHHLTSMIEEVLAYSSIEAGHEVVRPSEFLAGDLLRAVQAIIEPLARQKRLRVTCALPAEPLRLTSDIDKVRQVLVNLASNAVKFTEHGEVQLTLERRPLPESGRFEVRLGVHDTGSGIAPEDLRRLFRPFAQLDGGLTRRHGGTGLGLYISCRFAQLLGGRLDVESEAGAGSTFTLVLYRE
ncbi:MAG TPA: PAS domain-containing sensor histidine kinase [Gemmatimonadaceae bacterium]|nr:PAS domain-containing sensor histidine kinase [Gemmatimonadaceae bacterium]